MSSDQHFLPNESHLDYKHRVLDTKSATFCGAKWYYATIWLNSGMTTSCHHPLPHKVSVEEVTKNYKALSNTPQKKLERREMQSGKRCNGCDYCWRVEDLGPDSVSDRVYKSTLYSDNDLSYAFNADSEEDIDLKYLEISFDRTCNFACSYCNPAFSTSWAKDIKTNGVYNLDGKDGKDHYGHVHADAGQYDNEDSPYVTAFFKWWEADLHRTLTHLRLTGGEPLMSKHTWKLFDWFHTHKSDLYFAINSNLGAKDELIDRLIDSVKSLSNFHVYTSNESFGARAEYIRDGLDWNQWTSNCRKLVNANVIAGLHSMCTINAISLTGLEEYLDWVLEFKKEHGRDFPTFTLNILRFPSFQSVMILPQNIRNTYASKLNDWLLRNKNGGFLHDMEINHVMRLIEYLKTDKNTIGTEEERIILSREFKRFYTQYDQRRGKNFTKTFPELKDWYDSL